MTLFEDTPLPRIAPCLANRVDLGLSYERDTLA